VSSAAAQSRDLAEDLADFTATHRLLIISGFAVAIGGVSACVALGLLTLIGLFTNLFFFQRLSTALVTPEGHTLGAWVILVPVAGAVVIGVMARYGSERIRGHGIPEAIEAILINGSRIDPKVALLKPLSSAISIGSGGPFGAEGPIIMTGGAVGSLIAQLIHWRFCWSGKSCARALPRCLLMRRTRHCATRCAASVARAPTSLSGDRGRPGTDRGGHTRRPADGGRGSARRCRRAAGRDHQDTADRRVSG